MRQLGGLLTEGINVGAPLRVGGHSGFPYLVRFLVWVSLHAASHWFTAWPLVAWPEIFAVIVLISTHSRERHVLAALSTWLAVVLVGQACGVWLAVFEGWAATDDVPGMIVAAFTASLVAALGGMWLAFVVLDALAPGDRSAAPSGR